MGPTSRGPYHVGVLPPADGDTWCGLAAGALPVEAAMAWATTSDCGAVVTFLGTARDHSPGRASVDRLEYEAYEEHAVPRLGEVVAELRRRWPAVRRVALVHRTGEVPLREAAVVVVVAAPHRADAFEAGRFAIDELKATVPIWKRERWGDGESWGLDAQHLRAVGGEQVPG